MGNTFSFVENERRFKQFFGAKYRYVRTKYDPDGPDSDRKNFYTPSNSADAEVAVRENFQTLQSLRYQLLDNQIAAEWKSGWQPVLMSIFIIAASFLTFKFMPRNHQWHERVINWSPFAPLVALIPLTVRTFEYWNHWSNLFELQINMRNKLWRIDRGYIDFKNIADRHLSYGASDQSQMTRDWNVILANHSQYTQYCIEKCQQLNVHVSPKKKHFIDSHLVQTLPTQLPPNSTRLVRVLDPFSDDKDNLAKQFRTGKLILPERRQDW